MHQTPGGPVRFVHHADAAAGNIDATTQAIRAIDDALSGRSDVERILLKAAAGAGKSYALKRMVANVLRHKACSRVAVVAFANKQIFPLAEDLGNLLDKNVFACSSPTVGMTMSPIPRRPPRPWSPGPTPFLTRLKSSLPLRTRSAAGRSVGSEVILATQRTGTGSSTSCSSTKPGSCRFTADREIERLAPIAVGVGDVGQLPPLDPGENPWRGDRGYNPYRAWPTYYEGDRKTWSIELPAVWRPPAAQLPLWRSFYGDWDELHCVAAPGDRSLTLKGLRGDTASLWKQVATGIPTLVEVHGLPEAEAADVDLPLLGVLERWLDQLLAKGFTLHARGYDDAGLPTTRVTIDTHDPRDHKLIAVLATRNQAVDDATDMVDRLVEKHRLPDGVITASTVDSWQGQTNGITVAIHPLSGASALDEFNSAFGRLAVTCTRATHGLLVLSRAGLVDLLDMAPARPGTPLGEPGTRQLPRRTHQRILETFARTALNA